MAAPFIENPPCAAGFAPKPLLKLGAPLPNAEAPAKGVGAAAAPMDWSAGLGSPNDCEPPATAVVPDDEADSVRFASGPKLNPVGLGGSDDAAVAAPKGFGFELKGDAAAGPEKVGVAVGCSGVESAVLTAEPNANGEAVDAAGAGTERAAGFAPNPDDADPKGLGVLEPPPNDGIVIVGGFGTLGAL